MATNPPITIGPFTNVPAPGSGVKSDWAQQITNYVLRTAWTAVPFSGAWVNFDATQLCQYRKEGDRVFLRGRAKSGTATSVIFTLPAGFRPTRNEEFVVSNNGTLGLFTMYTDGTANCSGTNAGVNLSGISFSTVT